MIKAKYEIDEYCCNDMRDAVENGNLFFDENNGEICMKTRYPSGGLKFLILRCCSFCEVKIKRDDMDF